MKETLTIESQPKIQALPPYFIFELQLSVCVRFFFAYNDGILIKKLLNGAWRMVHVCFANRIDRYIILYSMRYKFLDTVITTHTHVHWSNIWCDIY